MKPLPFVDVTSKTLPSFYTVQNLSYALQRISLFSTMGLRHLVVVDGELQVKGIITRSDMNEHQLEHFWKEEVILPNLLISSCWVICGCFTVG
jgi:CBS-domain-containing membrane protein